jgi:hypothetical protein
MNWWFTVAAILIILLALVHSILGEWLLLGPLFRRRSLPRLIGSHRFAQWVLRFAWHLTTVLGWGTAGVLLIFARLPADGYPVAAARVIAITYAVCALVAGVGARLKHFSVWVFAVSAILVWLGCR